MDTQLIQILAGLLSSLIFLSGTCTMLFKVWKTKDISSYSWSSIMLNNAGNLIYWFYVLSLPFGPIYFLHGFYTVATVTMAVWYRLYRQHPQVVRRITQSMRRITQTMDVIQPGPVNQNHDVRRLQEFPRIR